MSTKTKTTPVVASTLADAAYLGEFVLSDLYSAHGAKELIVKGWIKATKKTRLVNGRGRPATIYTITAKGRKAAA